MPPTDLANYPRDSLRELKTCKSKMDTQSKQVSEYASRMDEYDKKFEENSRKFGTLLAVSLGIS